MSLWKIAWKSIRQRGIASLLTMFSMMLGVLLVVLVLSIHGVVAKSFRTNAALGYDTIIGARGGKLQLTLNSVYYLSEPIETIPYDYYLAFQSGDVRSAAIEDSIKYRTHTAQWQTADVQAIAAANSVPQGAQSLGSLLALSAIEQADAKPIGKEDEGIYFLFTHLAIPLCLGDYVGDFRVVATTPDFFKKIEYDTDKYYEFAEGRNFETHTEENGYYEAVIGRAAARNLKLGIGDKFPITHGAPTDSENAHEHDQLFTVVGILDTSYTPNDRGVFINIEGFYLIDDHVKPVLEDEEAAELPEVEHDHAHDTTELLPVEQREITAILFRATQPIFSADMRVTVNEGSLESTLDWSEYRPARQQRSAQAVAPIAEIYRLFQAIVDPIQWVLVTLTVLVCVVSSVSILVSIYNSMNDRKHEIAVMRALGADRITVMSIILLESIMLSVGGGVLGWVLAHTINAIASPLIESSTGVALSFWDIVPTEAWLIPGLILLAMLAGAIPAMVAYRTDVAKSLGS